MQPSPQRRLAIIGRHFLSVDRNGDVGPVNGLVTTTIAAPRVPAERIDKIFAEFFARNPAPGVVYGVVLDGALVHVGGLGTLHVGEDCPPGPESVFRIASMTKSFVAATVLLLRDEGVVRLDDAAEFWVPELRGLPLATGDSKPPTLRQLLSMNAGFPEDDPWADRHESMSDDSYTALVGKRKTFSRTSGVAFEYSNFGFTLLGRVIQNATNRPFRDVVTEKIITPLGLKNTVWSDTGINPSQLATGYALVDDAWVAQPIQTPGAFSALGGLYSSVADLAVWIAGFIDAWPPRDGHDSHPLCRASRREMQQVVTAMPLEFGAGSGLLRAQVNGYCLGLVSTENLGTGRTINHSGGYPGFGSHMSWHPACRVGVVSLCNSRYAIPMGPVAKTIATLVANAPQQVGSEPVSNFEAIRHTINAALVDGKFALIEPLLSANVDLDEALHRRAALVTSLAKMHGALTPAEGLTVSSPTQVAWWLNGEHGRVGVEIMLTPDHPPKVQKLDISSVQPPTADLEAAVTTALDSLNKGTDLSSILLPIQRTSWLACDGSRTGTVLLEGAFANVRLYIGVGDQPYARFVPDRRSPRSP